jgi:hypothetical protein
MRHRRKVELCSNRQQLQSVADSLANLPQEVSLQLVLALVRCNCWLLLGCDHGGHHFPVIDPVLLHCSGKVTDRVLQIQWPSLGFWAFLDANLGVTIGRIPE